MRSKEGCRDKEERTGSILCDNSINELCLHRVHDPVRDTRDTMAILKNGNVRVA